jgi:hypothetical protein
VNCFAKMIYSITSRRPNGAVPCAHWLPPAGTLLRFTRPDVPAFRPFLAQWEDLPEGFNLAGLYWELTGIGRAQLEGEI